MFGLSESQTARRVKVIAKAAGLADCEFLSGHSGRVGMARRMAQNDTPTHEIERPDRWKQGGGIVVATPAANPQGQRCAICSAYHSSRQRLNHSRPDPSSLSLATKYS